LREGDVIVRLGDKDIQNIEDLTDALQTHKSGDQVNVVVLRAGAPITLQGDVEQPWLTRAFSANSVLNCAKIQKIARRRRQFCASMRPSGAGKEVSCR
jgi:hypothetical protein